MDTVIIDVSTRSAVDTQLSIAKDLASDLLQGCYDDYLFFCYGSDSSIISQVTTTYFLVVGDLSRDNQNYYVSTDCKVYEITVLQSSSAESVDFDFSGNTYEVDPSPVSRFSGDGSYFLTEYQYFSTYTVSDYDLVRVSSQVPCIFYSSLENHPHIVKGVENYAFAGFCVLGCVFAFVLADRIFRRIF